MKKMKYPLMCPPFEFESFRGMSKEKAKEHFNWYISEIPSRLDLLIRAFEFTGGGDKKVLDFTPESLKPLWSWYIPQVKLVAKSKNEIETELKNYPGWMKDQINAYRISTETLAICMDIAKYFAEVFIRKFNCIKWDIITKPKSYVYVNRPVLVGFKNNNNMDPEDIVYILTIKVSKEKTNQDALYDMFNKWKDFI